MTWCPKFCVCGCEATTSSSKSRQLWLAGTANLPENRLSCPANASADRATIFPSAHSRASIAMRSAFHIPPGVSGQPHIILTRALTPSAPAAGTSGSGCRISTMKPCSSRITPSPSM